MRMAQREAGSCPLAYLSNASLTSVVSRANVSAISVSALGVDAPFASHGGRGVTEDRRTPRIDDEQPPGPEPAELRQHNRERVRAARAPWSDDDEMLPGRVRE